MSIDSLTNRFRFLNPEGEAEIPPEYRRISPRVDDLRGKTVGMLDDGACRLFMERLQELMARQYPDVKTRYWKKPLLSKPAPLELIDEIARSADVSIVGACI